MISPAANCLSSLLAKSNHGPRGWKRAFWDEAMRPLVSNSESDGLFSLFDFEAPAEFGPPKHHPVDDAEVITVTSGRLAIWTSFGTFAAEIGDVVHFPKGLEHSWKAIGAEPIKLMVVMSPIRFERLFDLTEERSLMRR